eukprot:COSAG05_NODE_8_length_40675_cov_148.837539_39_plen_76_part_00
MLHESTYVPLSSFYDLSAWSAPIMENTPGGWSSAPFADDAAASEVRPCAAPRTFMLMRAYEMYVDIRHACLTMPN